MSRLDDVMEMEDDVSESSGPASNGDRMAYIMEDDYEPVDEPAKDPDETGIKDDPIPSSDKPKEEKEKKDKKEGKEEEEEDKKKEEKKEEAKPTDKKKIKFKVDGQELEEEVSEQDLINNYSGQKAIQKKIGRAHV